MRRRFVITTAFLAAVLLSAGATAFASTGSEYEFKVNFPFMVNGESFPAGRYMVTREAPSILLLRGQNGDYQSTFIRSLPETGMNPDGSQPALTFRSYEKTYRLTNVWRSANHGWEIQH